jgi:hypothetical protein
LGALLAAAPATAFDYVAGIETRGESQDPSTVTGAVFHDLSRDGVRQEDEPGVAGVLVSNGREVVRTGEDGSYALPAYDNMTVMLVKPAAYDVPTDASGVPQYFYHHLPEGTPEALRYGGLAPTGPLPAEVNFPVVRTGAEEQFSCVMMGDTQPYSNTEVGYVRDATLDTILETDLSDARCMIMLGDVMGDDLNLLPRFASVFSVAGLPQWYVHGNHDFDFDATTDEHSADSWRQMYGPNYYAFEIGQVTFVALDNVVYPCGPEDAALGGDREGCTDPERVIYNGRVEERQMEWLANLLDETPEDRLIVMLHHIPFVSFIDMETGRHQTDNLAEIHALLAGRPAVSFSGHTHTFEYLAAGESYAPWREMVDIGRLPFDHVVGGAPSGNWFFGDLSFDGTPMSFARGGTPPGFMTVSFDGPDFTVDFRAAGQPAERQMGLGFNTPAFRDWFGTLMEWTEAREETGAEAPTPPLTVNDLPDTRIHTPEDLGGTVWLTANVWNGRRDTEVFATIGDGPRLPMERTQAGDGEGMLAGPEYADPFSVPRQMTVGRYAWVSGEGEGRAQGFELWQGTEFGPAAPQSAQPWMVADQSPHLWRLALPADLPEGAHVARVTAELADGRTFSDHIVFEVRPERPFPYWDDTLWQEEASN